MSDLENKRREKEGKYDKREILEGLLEAVDEIDEFVVAIKYKNNDDGVSSSTSEITEVIGLLELAKLTIMMSNGYDA